MQNDENEPLERLACWEPLPRPKRAAQRMLVKISNPANMLHAVSASQSAYVQTCGCLFWNSKDGIACGQDKICQENWHNMLTDCIPSLIQKMAT